MVIFGWDASDFDWDRGPMDLAAAREAGITFFTHKATEGTSTRHTHYGEALRRARDAGVPFLGAYHVVRTSPSIAAQVDYLLAYADQATPWWRTFPGWFWQCDLEHWPYDTVGPSRGVDFCAALEARTGKRALLYAPRWAYGNSIGGSAPLWASDYVSGPGQFYNLYPGDNYRGWQPYSGRTPVILQYTSSATIGRQTGCDANAFRGTNPDFAVLIGQPKEPERTNDMAILAKDDNTGQHYLCFIGGFRSYPIDPDRVVDIKYLASQGAFWLAKGPGNNAEWEDDGRIRRGWNPGAFGPVDPGPPPVIPRVDFDPPAAADLIDRIVRAIRADRDGTTAADD